MIDSRSTKIRACLNEVVRTMKSFPFLLSSVVIMIVFHRSRSLTRSLTVRHLRPRTFGRGPSTYLSASIEEDQTQKRKSAKEKRKKLIGLAKAVDRGQYAVTYQPGGPDSYTFQALSGLPKQLLSGSNVSATPFTVLGIESSCDDTGAAVVRSDGKILGEALASQENIHEEWGGVVPGLARDAHAENIDRIVQQALERAGMQSPSEVDAVGVTIGPGLEICLRVGSTKAQQIALEYQKPFVGIHHLEAHILMARLPTNDDKEDQQQPLEFPFLALLVSGGHCQLMKCLGVGRYVILGGTLDDSLGEAFDKTARLLGLPVGGGGGPAVEQLARSGDPNSVELPIPLRNRKDLDFSYAGLKTAVRKKAESLRDEQGLEDVSDLSKEDKANIAASFQNVAIKHLEQRLKYAMVELEKEGIQKLALVGGVAANQELRGRIERLCEERSWELRVPAPRLCTDQGAMAAWAAIERLQLGSSDDPSTQEVYARFPFATLPESDS